MRGRLAFQSVPADHPSVIALSARNPVVNPNTLTQMKTWGNNTNFDPLVGEQLLYVHVDGENTDMYSRNVGTGQLRVFGFESNDDPEKRAAGGYAIGDITASSKQYSYLPGDVADLFAAMADAEWVEG